jgi:thymidylate synthase (FAD)
VAPWVPHTWEAFLDYRMNSLLLTAAETEIVRALAAGDAPHALAVARRMNWLETGKNGGLKRNRERDEMEAKLAQLNLAVPWR